MVVSEHLLTAAAFLGGRAKVCLATITQVCNGRCAFCGIWRQPEPQHAPFGGLCRSLDRLRELGFRFVQFTGGEPLLHPDLVASVRHAHALGMFVNVVTNGSLLSEGKVDLLAAAGLGLLAVSVDHPDPAEHANIRGIPGLWHRIEVGVRHARRAGLPALASTAITRRNASVLPELVRRAERTGFAGVAFTYPTPTTNSIYPMGRGGEQLDIPPPMLRRSLQALLALKHNGHGIYNSSTGLRELLNRLEGKPGRFPCRAGELVFFLDHRLNLNRCMVLEETYGPATEVREDDISIRRECDHCSMMCFREPSVLFGGLPALGANVEHAMLALRMAFVR